MVINTHSIYSFSLQCNPWHDDQLKSPLIVNPNDLDGPTRETLKVLWRDLSQDQIISALMETRYTVSVFRFTTFFFANFKKRPNVQKLTYQLLHQRQKRYLDRLERSTRSMSDTEQIMTDFYGYDDGLLSPPPEKHWTYQTPKLITNIHKCKPVLLHTSRLDHSYTVKYHLASNQRTPLIPTAFNRLAVYTKKFFTSLFKSTASSRSSNDTVAFYCPAKSEFSAAGKLHYILSEVLLHSSLS
jgi:hypothetical protein